MGTGVELWDWLKRRLSRTIATPSTWAPTAWSMKRAGLQWVHRLCQEPRRLWKRYLINNPEFVFRIGLQLFGLRSYTIPQARDGRGLTSRAA